MNQDVKRHSRGFAGPLFIIGMPRSGTKLLRGLLNEHPRIGIPISETEFFPYWIAHWQEFGDLSKKENFVRFYKRMLSAPYFICYRRDGKLIDADLWFEWCHNFSPAGVFEALVRHDAGVEFTSDHIWGDKSPSYTTNMTLLKHHFPDAKFVHIIRDVRDYCLSINRAWGKHMLRAAQRWVYGVEGAISAAQAFPADCMQLRYR